MPGKTVRAAIAAMLASMWAAGVLAGEAVAAAEDRAPSVGKIHKLTGPVFAGTRLVLRAKAYGDLTEASWCWRRDGEVAGREERLDIASLGAEDFGTYTLTVTTPGGSATSEGFVVAEAPQCVAVEWGEPCGEGVPEGLTGIVQATGGRDFSLALLSDGTVAAWGNNESGACDVSEGLEGVSQVVAYGRDFQGGGGAGFAVKADGTVAAWGRTQEVETHWDEWAHDVYDRETGTYLYEGEWTSSTNGTDLAGTVPEGLTNAVGLAVGRGFALALTANGDVVSWGEGAATEVPEEVEDAVGLAVAGASGMAVALLADGTVVAWGDAGAGTRVIPSEGEGTVAVDSSANGCVLARMADGTVRKWGDFREGWRAKTAPVSGAGFIQTAGGHSCALVLDGEGKVQVWGTARCGEDKIPDRVQGAALGIGAGYSHFLALLADSDGDCIADVLEAKYGRDPSVWEPWERVTLGGSVDLEDGVPAGAVTVTLLDAEGERAGSTVADETGAWRIGGVLPGRYSLEVEKEAGAEPAEVGASGEGAAGDLPSRF